MINKRKGYNVAGNCVLKPDGTETEDCDSFIDLLSNGFKIRNATDPLNESGSTFVMPLSLEAPFVNSNGVPCNAR